MKKFMLFAFCFLLLGGKVAESAIHAESVTYWDGNTELEGYVAYGDVSRENWQPGVLVVHEWKGLGDYAKRRADMLAELGYVAFAVDMYGKGVRAADHKEAAELSSIYRNDRSLMRRRAKAGLKHLKSFYNVDKGRIAAIGYCFGGTTVLELARAGEDLKLVASFHGSLETPMPAAPGNVRGKVLVFNGEADAFISPESIAAFREEMTHAGADWQFISYPGAVHSFTVKEAGNDPSTGMAYSATADQASWKELTETLSSMFGG